MYCSSSATSEESVPTVGRFVFDRFANAFVAISYERHEAAAGAPLDSMISRPASSSHSSPLDGVKVSGLSSNTVTLVEPPVLAVMNRSSTLPAVFPMMRILKPYSPEPPRFANMFTPTAAGSEFRITFVVVVPGVVTVPCAPKVGAYVDAAPAAIAAMPGFPTKCHDFVMML